MPTYDYRCGECGHTFEEFQSISAAPLTQCPQCGKHALKRALSGGAGMIFKGDGFYLTDYKNKGGKSEKKSGTAGNETKKNGGEGSGKKESGEKSGSGEKKD